MLFKIYNQLELLSQNQIVLGVQHLVSNVLKTFVKECTSCISTTFVEKIDSLEFTISTFTSSWTCVCTSPWFAWSLDDVVRHIKLKVDFSSIILQWLPQLSFGNVPPLFNYKSFELPRFFINEHKFLNCFTFGGDDTNHLDWKLKFLFLYYRFVVVL